MQVSHFQLVERLGAGSSGEVFRAEDVYLRRPVALKFLTFTENSDQIERILQEARVCSSLHHPNIAVVYEIGWHDLVPFLAMELVEGETLSRRIGQKKVDPRKAIRYENQILDALREIHSRGIVHRDLKSSNIMITPRDQVKLIDFGLAGGSSTEAVVGTLEFLAPELLRNEGGDSRSDLYSAGAVLYHMLAGHPPFERATRAAMLTAILQDAVPLLGTSEKVDAILQKALAKKPSERYATAQEILDDLQGLDMASLAERPAFQQPRIAVLYLDRSDNEEETEYLRLGITEDIITDLSKVAGIQVLSKHAVLKFKDKIVDPSHVLQDLQVDYVLQGAVRKEQTRIFVNARLVEAGTVIWSQSFERDWTDVFELQDSVARQITEALQVRLTEAERKSIRQRPTADLRAYENYLRGRLYYNRATASDSVLAEENFAQAARQDPQFALAHAGLAEVYVQRYYNWFDRDRMWLQRAMEQVEKAAAINDQLPEVHCTRGMLLYLSGNYPLAMEEMQKAIRLDPHFALAHDHTGEIFLHTGDLEKAILAFHTELRINPELIYPYFYLVWIHSLLGDSAIAREILEKARAQHSRNPLLPVLQGVFASYNAELAGAEEHLLLALHNNPANSFAAGRLAVVYAETGQWDRAMEMAERATEEIDAKDHHAAFDRACVLSLSGETKKSLEWLNRAIDLGWRCAHHYRCERNLSAVRNDAAFLKLLERL